MNYSIGITTFVHRLDKYYKPLMNAISRMRPDIDKVVFVNGQHKKRFDEDYRKEIMRFSSLCPRTYLIMSPIVRGCAYMWNNLCNHTSTEYTLVLNDDLIIHDGFFEQFESWLAAHSRHGNESFCINRSFSHFCVHRQDLFDVGYFDERLLGFGEEDGDWLWRWEVAKEKNMRMMLTQHITNCIDQADTNSENMEKSGKYSAFNAKWIFENKYDAQASALDPHKPHAVSAYGRPIQMRDGASNLFYYPAEKWYRENIDKV